MKTANSVYKIPQGKLLKVSLTYDEAAQTISEVQLYGDFFIHPEVSLELIEQALRAVSLQTESIVQAVSETVEANAIQLFGITPEGIAQGILLCIEEGK
ncbi:hypothetical protein AUK40_01185 [Candidatus Wirthbacteria bacterium CG2_30_54_11]|uniref:Uncharacterized protein n=1 Tax=Candidatus Wirthbacteria bacterium CG2_30_54_11 TaxID=1817892 RepID=A0A1J5INM1_9BACT|nr:MAG: hypothetical protein AUK40_01185 [Candidatus Wirthbacteria bacterium CG2_30_54_11]